MGTESERDNHIHKEIYPSQEYPRTEANQSRRKLPAEGSWPSGEKKTDLEILTSPKGGLHEKCLWKALEKPQIDDRFKEKKKRLS